MTTKARKRINITLPPETLELIDQVAPESRSEFINQAVRMYSRRLLRARVQQRLKQAYQERIAEDLAIAQEWEPLERELWEHMDNEGRS